jgi:hypothetical protein
MLCTVPTRMRQRLVDAYAELGHFRVPAYVSDNKLKGAAACKARSTFLRENRLPRPPEHGRDHELRRLLLPPTVFCRIGCDRKSPQINTPEKTANTDTTAAASRIGSTGIATSFWISRQAAELPNAIFDADQIAEKEI